MNTNIVVSLDTRRKKKDGTYPIVLRLGHNKRTTSIPTGYSVAEKDWDEKNRHVRKSYSGVTSVTRLNNLLQKTKTEAMDVITKLHEKKQLESMSLAGLRDRIDKPIASLSFFAFANHEVEALNRAHRFGTARSYKGVVSVLREFNRGRDLSFPEINFQFLTRFETNHVSKGNTLNGLSVYIRAIRALYNKAIKSGIVEKEHYPFDDYKIKSVLTEKRALDWNLIKSIIELELPEDHLCFDARNYFLASYMMYGMNFTDMAFLEWTDVRHGRVQYRRRKTGKLYDLKLTASLETIFAHYRSKAAVSNYVFPILRTNIPSQQVKEIQWARKRYNKKLKILANLCGIEQNLTSYVSRHSFATQAMLMDVPLNAISAMLGHSSLKTTEVYLKSLPSNILDDYNAKILGD